MKVCIHCQSLFEPNKRLSTKVRATTKFCSAACHQASRISPPKPCLICGKPIPVPPRGSAKRRKFCGLKCSSEARKVAIPARYRSKKAGGVHMGEHRAIMEAHLGRKLMTDEVVHHVNEDKADNRIENLNLMSARDHGLLHFPPKRPTTTDCAIYGATFTPHKTKRGRTKTCSKACRYAASAATRRQRSS